MNTSRSLTLATLFVVGITAFARATPVTRDLGRGLTYYRVHTLPADLPPADGAKGALVLDLRFVSGDRAAASALAAWLHFRSSEKSPAFVLFNDSTASSVRAAANPREGRPGVLTLAPIGRSSPDISVKVSADADRRGYDALENGTSLDDLIASEPTKDRHDEASLIRERTTALPEADELSDLPDAPSGPPASAPTPPLTDPLLQRAVQLHRALLALKKF